MSLASIFGDLLALSMSMMPEPLKDPRELVVHVKTNTRFLGFFQRKSKRNTLYVVPEKKKSNLFWFYSTIHLEEYEPTYFDFDIEDAASSDPNIWFKNDCFVDLNEYCVVFTRIKNEYTKDGLPRFKISRPQMDRVLEYIKNFDTTKEKVNE